MRGNLTAMREKRRPKLGQHFLSSPGYQRKIIEALPLQGDELVVEVGPGTGAMTGGLAERARRVVAVEVDRRLADDLEERFRDRKNVEIRHGDILEFDPGGLCREFRVPKCFVFGNLPFHISSPFLQHIFGFAPYLSGMGLLLQYEVAGRIVAAPGRRAYGFLSVLAQYYSRPKLLWKVPPEAFAPPPQVQTGFVQFEFPGAGKDYGIEAEEGFLDFLRACFREKRKTLVNNLAKNLPRRNVTDLLAELGMDSRIRAEQIGLQGFSVIYRRLKSR